MPLGQMCCPTKMRGADTIAGQNNDTHGIFAHGNKIVRVDHCELPRFS